MEYDDDSGPGNIALMRSLIAEGKTPDPEMARSVLATFCRMVRDRQIGNRHSTALLEWMADGIAEYLKDADKRDGLEKALHLRGRGPRPEVQARNYSIALDVLLLVEQGHPIADNAEGAGALAIAAEKWGMSEPEVRKIYYGFDESERKTMLRIYRLVRDPD